MAPPTRPLHSRSTSANSIHVHQDVTVTTSTRAEIGINEPSNFEFVSIETSGLNRSNTHKSNGASRPKLLSRWSTSRRGSMSVAHSMHNEDFPNQTSRDLQAIKDQRDGLKALADFLVEVPPPPTNHMADIMNDEPKKPRSFKSSLFGIFGRKKKKKGGEAGLIQLPDTAVAATTTSGARYIAISFPETLPDNPRSRPNTSSSKHVKTTVSVLNSVAEVSENSPRNTFAPRFNNRGTENRAEEKLSLVSEPVLGDDEMRTMQNFFRQQRQSMVNDTPSPTRPLSITKNREPGRPRSTRYSIFPPVSPSRDISLQHTEFREVSDPVTASSEAQCQSVRPKSGPATFSAHYNPQIQIPPRHSSLFKVPLPRFGSREVEDGSLLDEDMEENTQAQDFMPEFEMLSAVSSASTFSANQRLSMAQQLESSRLESNPKRTVSGSTFGTPSRQENSGVLRVVQTESSRPFSSPTTDIQTARNRAFYGLSSISTSPSFSYQNRQQLVKARKARDISIYNYNQHKSQRPSTSRIYDLESSKADEEELATITSAGITAQVNRRRASIPAIPLCEQLVSDFSGPNHRGNDTDLFYDAQTSIPGPSPMVSISDFPAVTSTATPTPTSTALATHKAPVRRAIGDATTPPPSSSDSESFFNSPRYSYHLSEESEARYQVTRSPTALVDRRQERRVMRRVSADEHRARELEFRLSRLENDNLILKSALLGISESVQGMRDFILGEEM